MSSRSTYEAVAAKLAWSLAFADHCSTEAERVCARAAVASAIHGIADAFEAENPRFDRARFVGAATTVQS
jgi:hypothetical protein